MIVNQFGGWGGVICEQCALRIMTNVRSDIVLLCVDIFYSQSDLLPVGQGQWGEGVLFVSIAGRLHYLILCSQLESAGGQQIKLLLFVRQI